MTTPQEPTPSNYPAAQADDVVNSLAATIGNQQSTIAQLEALVLATRRALDAAQEALSASAQGQPDIVDIDASSPMSG